MRLLGPAESPAGPADGAGMPRVAAVSVLGRGLRAERSWQGFAAPEQAAPRASKSRAGPGLRQRRRFRSLEQELPPVSSAPCASELREHKEAHLKMGETPLLNGADGTAAVSTGWSRVREVRS